MNLPAIQFNDIGKMQDYFNSLSKVSEKEDINKLSKELNDKMSELLKSEKYEEAASLRDYMIRRNIKRNSNF
jgi:protein-arginine kinase activator protein McsA